MNLTQKRIVSLLLVEVCRNLRALRASPVRLVEVILEVQLLVVDIPATPQQTADVRRLLGIRVNPYLYAS